jgi:hypothetical protein
MGDALNTTLLTIKPEFNYKVVNGRVVIISVIHNKPANLISEAEFKYNAADSVSVVEATMLAELL